MGREVVNLRSSDIVVIVGGSSGTFGELATAYDGGKLIGVLTGTGGISDIVEAILTTCNKKTGARVIYDGDPRRLSEQLLEVYRTEHFQRPSAFCRGLGTATSTPVEGSRQDVVCGMWVAPRTAAARRTRNDSVTSSVRFTAQNASMPTQTISNQSRPCVCSAYYPKRETAMSGPKTVTLPPKRTEDTGVTEQACAPIAAGRETEIRERAYDKWKDAGCACSNGVEFWLQAEAQLAAEARPSTIKQ